MGTNITSVHEWAIKLCIWNPTIPKIRTRMGSSFIISRVGWEFSISDVCCHEFPTRASCHYILDDSDLEVTPTRGRMELLALIYS